MARAPTDRPAKPSRQPVRELLVTLYTGKSRRAVRAQYALLAFDVFTIAYFTLTATVSTVAPISALNYAIAAVLALDYVARLWIERNRWRYALSPIALVDLLVIVSLLLPLIAYNLAFLRVVRAVRLLRSYHVLRDMRRRYKFFRRNEDAIQSTLNLFVFVFIVTALVFVLQEKKNPEINTYGNALYFTVTTLSTTGFGDIVLVGEWGRLLAIAIMVGGVALFVRLAQTLFRPLKVRYKCQGCGLNRHNPDALHCKHCGREVKIETAGD